MRKRLVYHALIETACIQHQVWTIDDRSDADNCSLQTKWSKNSRCSMKSPPKTHTTWPFSVSVCPATAPIKVPFARDRKLTDKPNQKFVTLENCNWNNTAFITHMSRPCTRTHTLSAVDLKFDNGKHFMLSSVKHRAIVLLSRDFYSMRWTSKTGHANSVRSSPVYLRNG